MYRTMTRLCAAATVAMALGATVPAHAEDWIPTGDFGWLGVGKAYQLEKGHVYWVGEFSGIFINDKGSESLFDHAGVRCPGSYDLDFARKQGRASGSCIIADPGGDQAYLTWVCDGDTVDCRGTYEYTGGGGKYQAINGKGTFHAATRVNWPDGMASGHATWNR